MRTLLLAAVFSTCALGSMAGQTDSSAMIGTWIGPARCQHGDGETITLVITRDPAGKLQGATDWALSTSDGRHGPPVPFTALTVEGTRISASTTADGRTTRLTAVVRGDAVAGRWVVDGGDDEWTFAGTRRQEPAEGAPPR
jgi:hypothetical protein